MFAPLLISAVLIAVETRTELPPDSYVAGALMIIITVVLLATIGSRVIYGLRRQVSAAMRLGQYTLDVCVQHVTAQPKPPTSHGAKMPVELEQLILHCLAKHPGERPASAAALASLLRAISSCGRLERRGSAALVE